jgi:hypothetical protein
MLLVLDLEAKRLEARGYVGRVQRMQSKLQSRSNGAFSPVPKGTLLW